MTCICGHSDDLHVESGIHVSNCGECMEGSCTACSCNEFYEDLDRDELETE